MDAVSVEKLYKNFGILAEAGDNLDNLEDLYGEIISAANGNEKERRLACQLIPKFFKSFPNLTEKAFSRLLDLCEDPLIIDLPTICKQCPEYAKRTADIMAQLLQVKDSSELVAVQSSLLSLLQLNPEGAVAGFFNQVTNGDDAVRDQCLSFLKNKVKTLPIQTMPELEASIINKTKSCFDDASPEEIGTFMDILLWTKLGNDAQGHTEIVNVIAEQMEADKPFNAVDDDVVERLISFCKAVKPLFSHAVTPNRFILHFCKEVLPCLKYMSGYDECNGYALESLKLFTELAVICTELQNPDTVVESIYKLLNEVLPQPENGKDDFDGIKFQFTYVECLLFSFHKFFLLHPSLFAGDTELSRFRSRLQYFSRVLQGYIRTLRESIKESSGGDSNTREYEIKTLALKTTININMLIKDFFYNPPVNRTSIRLSWTVQKVPNDYSPQEPNYNGPNRNIPETRDNLSSSEIRVYLQKTSTKTSSPLLKIPVAAAGEMLSNLTLLCLNHGSPARKIQTLIKPGVKAFIIGLNHSLKGEGDILGLKQINNRIIRSANPIPSKKLAVKRTHKNVQRALYQPPNGKYSKSFCKPKE